MSKSVLHLNNADIYQRDNLVLSKVNLTINNGDFYYLIGKSFGKNQLIKLSPNKTIEGFLGGFIISFISTFMILFYLYKSINFNTIFFILIIILSAFIGDIIESFFKRKNNLKNSSNFIPGHGGIFDRFDSFLFSIILYSVSIKFLL